MTNFVSIFFFFFCFAQPLRETCIHKRIGWPLFWLRLKRRDSILAYVKSLIIWPMCLSDFSYFKKETLPFKKKKWNVQLVLFFSSLCSWMGCVCVPCMCTPPIGRERPISPAWGRNKSWRVLLWMLNFFLLAPYYKEGAMGRLLKTTPSIFLSLDRLVRKKSRLFPIILAITPVSIWVWNGWKLGELYFFSLMFGTEPRKNTSGSFGRRGGDCAYLLYIYALTRERERKRVRRACWVSLPPKVSWLRWCRAG